MKMPLTEKVSHRCYRTMAAKVDGTVGDTYDKRDAESFFVTLGCEPIEGHSEPRPTRD